MEFIVQEAIEKTEANLPELEMGQANMKVIGIGGGGCNAASWLHKKGIKGAEVVVMNTDKQHLDISSADRKILIGKDLTRGLGAGGNPTVGQDAARESMNDIKEVVRDTDMVFVAGGLGGGTATGALPIVARAAKEAGAIVIGVVTMPFDVERVRIDKAEFGLQQLREECDTVIVIDNNRLVQIAGQLPVEQAFAVANELISTMMKAIVETIAVPSLVNLDYADVKAIMSNGAVSAIGIGESQSENRVEEAVKRALSNPLLDVSYAGANGALIQVAGGKDLTLDEVSRVGELITESLDPDSNVIWGARITDDMTGKLRVLTIITGVKSPYILGKSEKGQPSDSAVRVNEELGIDLIH